MKIEIEKELLEYTNEEKSKILSHYFKTNKGEYGEGDIFLGLTIPQIRNVIKQFYNLISFDDLLYFITSKYHEFRVFGFLILVSKYQKTKIFEEKKEIINFYLKNIKYVNNWDIVDLTCYKLLGDYIYNFQDLNTELFFNFANSENLWLRRISIVSTMYSVKKNQLDLTLQLAKILINDKRDLIQKATGWLLREVGKQNETELTKFLNENISNMYPVAISYSMEKLTLEQKIELRKIKKDKN